MNGQKLKTFLTDSQPGRVMAVACSPNYSKSQPQGPF